MVGQSPPSTEYFSVEDASSAIRDGHESNGNMEQILRNMQQELEEAQATHAALYLELEKERSAAASAADEAMAMILRLQSEKAAVQMESRQYQRMIEEKYAYDEEEMEILKEIIVRREREKHVLEKELEAYRQNIHSGGITEQKPEPLFDSSNDPMPLLKSIYDSIGTKENVKSKMKWAEEDVGTLHLDFPDIGEDCNIEFQEKGIVTLDVYPTVHCQSSTFVQSDIKRSLNESQELQCCNESSCLSAEEMDEESKIRMGIPADGLDGDDLATVQKVSYPPQLEFEPSVFDVRVIEDNHAVGPDENGKEINAFNLVCASETSERGSMDNESPGTSNVDPSPRAAIEPLAGVDREIQSCSVVAGSCKLMDTMGDTYTNLRRNSMSAIDTERFKLEAEVENLRKRLKAVQQGRGNLTFPVEYREKEAFQLQLLEEIACQLQQIRKFTEPGRNMRRASLPPLSSKVSCCPLLLELILYPYYISREFGDTLLVTCTFFRCPILKFLFTPLLTRLTFQLYRLCNCL